MARETAIRRFRAANTPGGGLRLTWARVLSLVATLHLCWLPVAADNPAVLEQAVEWSDASATKMAEADSQQSIKRWEPAMSLYREAMTLSPHPPPFQQYVLFNNIGWSLFNMGEWAAAEEEYRKALNVQQPSGQPPTDHAYINLATLYKAQGRSKATIKVYQAAVALTKQLPTWAALGFALMREFRVEEAVSTLQEALALHGDGATAAQEVHNYLGQLNVWRRRWSSASHHFIKSVDLGLPAEATGCRAGRWTVVEGWQTTSSFGGAPLVTVHPLPVGDVTRAIAAAVAVGPPTRTRANGTKIVDFDLAALATEPFFDAVADETYQDRPDDPPPDGVGAATNGESAAASKGAKSSKATSGGSKADGKADGASGEGHAAPDEGGYKLIELRGVALEGQHLTSLFHPGPECKYYVGEHTASASPRWDFGVNNREQNASYDKTAPFEVHTKMINAPTFGIADMRGGAFGLPDDHAFQLEVLTKFLLLLKAVVEPEWPKLKVRTFSPHLPPAPSRISPPLHGLR